MAVSDIPRKQKKERAARPMDQAVRHAIETGNPRALRLALEKGGRLPPSSSRQHPLFIHLASLKQDAVENPDTLPLVELLLDRGLPAQWRVGATTEDLKRLSQKASSVFSKTLPRKPRASTLSRLWDIGASLVERLSVAGQWTAAVAVVNRLPQQALWPAEPPSRQAMFPLQGVLAAGAWPVASRLLERILSEVPPASLGQDFWQGLEASICQHIASSDPGALAVFDRIAQARTQRLSATQRKELLLRRHSRVLPKLDPRYLDRYLAWFPEEMESWRHPSSSMANQGIWECFLTRACILGPGDELWKQVWSDPSLAGQLNLQVGGLTLDYAGSQRGRLPHVADRHRAPPLPLSPLDLMVLRVDRDHYLRDETDANSLDEDVDDDLQQSKGLKLRRSRNWQSAIDAMLDMGAVPGFLRQQNGFRWTYAELWARQVHELSYSRPPPTFWQSHPWMCAPNPRTGRSPFHEYQGTQDQWQYWYQSGFDPSQRDHRGVCAFAWPLRHQLNRHTNEVRDFAKQVEGYMAQHPELWTERDGHGLSLRDVACAHPVLLRALKASGHTPGPRAQSVAIAAARPKIVDELRRDYPQTEQCPGGWTLAGLAVARLGRMGNDDRRLFPMLDLLKRLSPSGDLDGPHLPGTFVRQALICHRAGWMGMLARARGSLNWGDPDQWRPIHLLRLLERWPDARSRLSDELPPAIARRALDVLLTPASWAALEDLTPRRNPERFVELLSELLEKAPDTSCLWEKWQHAHAALSVSQQEGLATQLHLSGLDRRLEALEQSAAMEGATAPAPARSRGGIRL